MLISHLLPLRFDAERLRADLERILPGEWTAHFNRDYYEGAWKALALRSTSGRANQIFRAPDDCKVAVDTPLLERCAYLREVLAAFECPVLTARLLSLGPGSKIKEHEDFFLGLEYGLVRVHIPITTNPRVEFIVGGQALSMRPGEAWYIDFSLPHHVTNHSEEDRVHLVLDCTINAWLDAMIPFEIDSEAFAGAGGADGCT